MFTLRLMVIGSSVATFTVGVQPPSETSATRSAAETWNGLKDDIAIPANTASVTISASIGARHSWRESLLDAFGHAFGCAQTLEQSWHTLGQVQIELNRPPVLDCRIEAFQPDTQLQGPVRREPRIGIERVVAEIFERLKRKAEARLSHHRRSCRPFVHQGTARRPRNDPPVSHRER